MTRPIMQKHNHFRSRKLLDAARGQSCQNCGANDGTVVAAHSNQSQHGKGKSIKADDCFVAWLCFRCHSWLDQGTGGDPTGMYEQWHKDEMWQRAHTRTLKAMFDQQILRIA